MSYIFKIPFCFYFYVLVFKHPGHIHLLHVIIQRMRSRSFLFISHTYYQSVRIIDQLLLGLQDNFLVVEFQVRWHLKEAIRGSGFSWYLLNPVTEEATFNMQAVIAINIYESFKPVLWASLQILCVPFK